MEDTEPHGKEGAAQWGGGPAPAAPMQDDACPRPRSSLPLGDECEHVPVEVPCSLTDAPAVAQPPEDFVFFLIVSHSPNDRK